MTGGLQRADYFGLLGGQHVRLHLVDADRGADGFRGDASVAGQHHHAEPLRAERAHGIGRRRLHAIGHADETGQLSVDGDEHDRLPSTSKIIGCGGKLIGRRAE